MSMLPTYDELMLPLLKFASDQKEHSIEEVLDHFSKVFMLTEEEKNTLLPSGQETVIRNRAGWARTYLKKAGLLEYPVRGRFRITDRGLVTLSENPSKIDVDYLRQFPEFVEFKTPRKDEGLMTRGDSLSERTPQELLEEGYRRARQALAEDLLRLVKKEVEPRFFEKLVKDLLLRMGYGGSLEERGRVVGGTGDEGIDVMVEEDKLGLDVIHVQAKRWENPIGGKEMRNFVGALTTGGRKATKGVFVTTSHFTEEARKTAESAPVRIVLIDGERLAQLMIDYDVGLRTTQRFEIKEIDSDYFG